MAIHKSIWINDIHNRIMDITFEILDIHKSNYENPLL